MSNLDLDKRRIVEAWMKYSSGDGYSDFIALWIAFNGLCYGEYAHEAVRPRPDLQQKKSVDVEALISEGPIEIKGIASRKTGGRIELKLTSPDKIVITIQRRFTEDLIYDRFAEEWQGEYVRWLQDDEFHQRINALHRATLKPEEGLHYVINLARLQDYFSERSFKARKSAGTIAAWEELSSLRELKGILYQIRCNVFHGGKTPGEPHDDSLVRAAVPVVRFLCERLLTS